MFSTGHLIWIGISMVLIVGGLAYCLRHHPTLRAVQSVCMVVGIISEVFKVFSVAQIVPMVDPVIAEQNGEMVLQWIPTGEYTPYLAMEHLPFELCSLYLLFLLLSLALRDGPWKKGLFAVMYASGTLGGLLGIVLASITAYYDTTASYFTSVRAWQYFLYHSMIVMASIYIGFCRENPIEFHDWKKAILGLLFLDVPTFYLNSVFSSEVFVHDTVVGVTHRINFFSSYVNPLGLALTEKWQWILYLCIRAAAACCLVFLLYCLLLCRKKGGPAGGSE